MMADDDEDHTGIVTNIGWDEANEHFRAIVVFPYGPPALRCKVVWEKTPVRIVVVSGETP